MPDIVRTHQLLIVFLLCCAVGLFTWWYGRWRDRSAFGANSRFVWQCVQFHGGGSVYTPIPMTKEIACEWASKLGHIAYVDDTHHKIFYRSRA